MLISRRAYCVVRIAHRAERNTLSEGANDETSQIPVIMLTARKTRDDMEKAKEMGAVEYITKPFKAVEVVDKVLRHLN